MRHRPTRILLATLMPLLILLAFSASALATGAAGKMDVCHWASHKYVEIRVSANAVPAHLAHGDVLPDEYGECSPGSADQG
jgi:hypothetical protein